MWRTVLEEELMEVFVELWQSWTASESLISKLEEFACRMYAASSKADKVNTLCRELFLSKRGDVDSSMLPPCEDSLIQHTHRANYQAGVWRRALEPMPDVPPANGYGWVSTADGALKIDWIKSINQSIFV